MTCSVLPTFSQDSIKTAIATENFIFDKFFLIRSPMK